ncbi:hypothetical protein DFQ27_002653 [Actinomortierella ambigua]|uniref:ArfGap-domain-containing protein n=1 Tax=Actinomortierella ambigua TaxID=1343610 RepID=A0A9P6QKU1_9FUNG|nr:hypothetical protein DFQ27_002653 [Actinomortierella ambigua]
MSLPSLPEAAGELSHSDAQLASTAPSSLTGTANTTPMGFDTEDGPLFRATVNECENHIKDMKNATKRILKAAQTVMELRKAWAAAEEAFAREMESFRPAEPLVARYSRPMAQNLSERADVIAQQMRNLLIEPLTRFYTSDIKAAETRRKTFEDESRDYYTLLSKYMAMKQDRGRKKAEADAKYERKRRQFELRRHEYWGFLLDMRVGGSKSDEILHHLTNYSEKHCRHVMDMGLLAEELRTGLDRMNDQLLESHRKSTALRKEWQEKRRELLDGSDDVLAAGPSGTRSPLTRGGSNNELQLLGASLLSHPSSSEGTGGSGPTTGATRRKDSIPGLTLGESLASQDSVGAGAASASSPPPSHSTQFGQSQHQAQPRKFAGIRDLEQQDVDASQAMGRRKEGFLFATSRPSLHNNSNVLEKPSINWHKYWCVLSEGHMHEYSHWKKGVTTLHNEPINLKTATVRASRNQDRRFCFEIITPKFRRVYQATSTEDMQSWITIISNAIQSLLNGTSSYRNLNISSISPDYQRLLAGSGGGGSSDFIGRPSMEQALIATLLPDTMQERIQPGQVIGKKRGTSAAFGLNEFGQMMIPFNTHSNASETGSTPDQDQLGIRLLEAMRTNHPANNSCVECGVKNPDWCAINLGILLCIECSGIHRSLGTHISKVRSFTLDTTSYTRDLFDFIRAVGNECSNQVWEALLHKDVSEGGLDPATTIRKPVYNDSRDYKVEYIQKKYVDRLFVDRLQFVPEAERTSHSGKTWTNEELHAYATKALFQASMDNNILAVLAAYAAGADLNAIQEVEVEQETAGSCMSDASDQPSQHESVESSPSPTQQRQSKEGSSPESSNTKPETSSPSPSITRTASTASTPVPAQEELTCSSPPAILTTSPDLRSRSWTGYSNASFCLMQTSPLLLALRHGTPFTLDPQYEVYPLAEFMLQNGAASNLSVEVRLLDDTPLEASANAAVMGEFSSSTTTTATTLPTTAVTTKTISAAATDEEDRLTAGDGSSVDPASKKQSSTPLSVASTAASEPASLATMMTSTTTATTSAATTATTASSTPTTTFGLPSTSTNTSISTLASASGAMTTSSLGTGTTATTITIVAGAVSPSSSSSLPAAHRNGWDALDVDPEHVRQLHMRTNRRSLGQVVHMRGEEGATAMEYLRSKSAARGEPLAASSASASASASPVMNAPRMSMQLGSASPMGISGLMASGGDMGGLNSGAAVSSSSSSLSTMAISSPGSRRPGSGEGRGLVPVLSAIKHSLISSEEPITAGAGGVANHGDASEQSSSTRGESLPNASKELLSTLHHSGLASSVSPLGSPASSVAGGGTTAVAVAGGGGGHGQHERHSSRAGKMKATLTKSLRMSAAYIKHSIGKDDKDHHHHVPPVLLSPSSSSTSSGTSSILSGHLFSPLPPAAPSSATAPIPPAKDTIATTTATTAVATSVAATPTSTLTALSTAATATATAAVPTTTTTSTTTNNTTTPPSSSAPFPISGGYKQRKRTTSTTTILSALSGKGGGTKSSASSVAESESSPTPLSGQYVILHKTNSPPTTSPATFTSSATALEETTTTTATTATTGATTSAATTTKAVNGGALPVA